MARGRRQRWQQQPLPQHQPQHQSHSHACRRAAPPIWWQECRCRCALSTACLHLLTIGSSARPRLAVAVCASLMCCPVSSRVCVCRASRACCAFYKRRRSGCELTRRREITFERILHINTKRVQDRAPKNYRSHTRMTFHQKSRHQPCFFSKLRLQPFDLVHKPLLQPLRSQIGADDVHAERNHRGGVSGSLGMAV